MKRLIFILPLLASPAWAKCAVGRCIDMKKIILILSLVLLVCSQALAAVEIERVVVNGVCRAWKHYNNSGTVVKIEVFPDSAIGSLNADTSTVGSIGWAAANTPDNGVILIHPGTYQVDRKITLNDNVTVWAYGAKIQRINQIATTTATSITSGVTTQIIVADATGLLVGQSINILNGSTYDTSNRTISNIAGTTITVSTAFGVSVSGTTNVYLSFEGIGLYNGGKIYGLEIDGNRSNYTFYRWEVAHAVLSVGSGNAVENCYLHDLPGEGISEGAESPWNNLPTNIGNRYLNNRLININGNGIHVSASIGSLIQGNHIESANLQNAIMGHGGGCVAFSAQIRDARIIDNYFASSVAGVGYMKSFSAANTLIKGNVIRNMTSYAIEAIATTQNNQIQDLIIDGNKISNAISISVGQNSDATNPADPTGNTTNGSPIISSVSSMTNIQTGMTISGTGIPADSIIVGSDGVNQIIIGDISGMPVNCTANGTGITLAISGQSPARIQISNNKLLNTGIELARVYAAAISGNTIEWYPSDITSKAINLSNFLYESSITNNTLRYGLAGVSADTGLTDVVISGNSMSHVNYYGIFLGGANSNVLLSNNVISNDATANAGSFQGISVPSGTSVKSNQINLTTGYSTIRVQGSTSGIVIQGNKTSNAAYNGSSRYDIRVESGSTGTIIVNNQCNDTVSDAGTSTVKRDNDAY